MKLSLIKTHNSGTLTGGTNGDHLYGMGGNDSINGGDGNDYIEGGAGQDTLKGEAGNDQVDGGAGNDTIYGDDNEYLDSVIGGDDILRGGAGNDKLYGEGGDDKLYGDAGNDTLDGGAGKDRLEGGTGNDSYQIKRGEGGDTITDSDGKGSIRYGSIALGGGKNKSKGEFTYYDNEKSPTYSYITSGDSNTTAVTLTIRNLKSGELISTAQDFKNHQLGIHLKDKEDDKPKTPKPPPSIPSDMGGASYIPSPIILDLDGDGVETTKQGTGTYFDHDANGFAESTGWVGKDDGLLVRDLDGNGVIDTGRELFGSETLLANGSKAANGFAALAELDSNHDGKIDSSDAAFSTLQIWQDTNSDGYSNETELKTLAQAGIASINLNYTSTAYTIANPGFGNTNIGWQTDASNNQHRQLGSYTSTDGTTHAATDVWMQVNRKKGIEKYEVANDAEWRLFA